MQKFNGIPENIFDSCQKSEKIRVPINLLKDLQAVIEPKLQKINPQIKGHVSRIKDRASNNYRNWAWLYFNTQPKEAYRYSQLAVNISPNRLFVGVDVRTPHEYQTFKKEITKIANTELIERLIKVLGSRELFFSTISGDWDYAPRYHSVEELRGQLLSPNLSWINIPFERNDPKLASKQIANEIFEIFKDLYNVYAFASGNKPISQNVPIVRPFVPAVVVDNIDLGIDADQSDDQEIADFLSGLKESSNETVHHLPGKNDQIIMKRKALEYDLKPLKTQFNQSMITIYSDSDIGSLNSASLKDYAEFAKLISEIGNLFPVPKGFLKIMYVNPLTDARYIKNKDDSSIFLNLAAFHEHRNQIFWLFTITRELAYIRKHQLGYPFVNDMRRLMVYALKNGISKTYPADSKLGATSLPPNTSKTK